MSDATLRWEAYEHDHVERTPDWYWALGIAAVCIALTSLLFHDALFGLVIIIAAVTMGLHAQVPPPLTRFELSDRGFRVGDTLHRFDDIISFWIAEESGHPHPVILVDTTKPLAPNLIVPLEIDVIDAEAVRALFLENGVNEVPMREPLSHKILEGLGF